MQRFCSRGDARGDVCFLPSGSVWLLEQLPEFLRMIGFLRRLEVFSERELRLAFLHSRDCWLRRNISVIPTQNAYLFVSSAVVQASRALRVFFERRSLKWFEERGRCGREVVLRGRFDREIRQRETETERARERER